MKVAAIQLWKDSVMFRIVFLSMIALLVIGLTGTGAIAQGTQSALTQLTKYVNDLGKLAGKHDERIKALEAKVAAQQTYNTQLNVYIKDLTCKFNNLTKNIAENVPIIVGNTPNRACPDISQLAPVLPAPPQ